MAIKTNAEVQNAAPGSHSLGNNLILKVQKTGTRSWVFRYNAAGKAVEIGIGGAGANGKKLADARKLATKMRQYINEGKHPRLAFNPKFDPTGRKFREVAADYVERLRSARGKNGLPRNKKAVEQWPSTLEKFVLNFRPEGSVETIGDKRARDITYLDLKAVLEQSTLAALPETQSRVKQRLSVILTEAAKEDDEPSRPNPAKLVELSKRPEPEHFAALPWEEMPKFYAELSAINSTSAKLLRFIILTAARFGEARAATFDEIVGNKWTVPPTRMKARKSHTPALCDEALPLIAEQKANVWLNPQNLIFPGPRGKPLSDVAVAKTLKKLRPVTIHGFRSSFREWAEHQNGFSKNAIENCLAHTVKGVEGAYQRSNLFNLRVEIMNKWQAFLLFKSNELNKVEDKIIDKLINAGLSEDEIELLLRR